MPKSSSPNGEAQPQSSKSATIDAAEFNEPPPTSLAFADWQLLDKSGKAELYKVATQRFAMRQLVGQEYYYKFYKYNQDSTSSFFELINGLKMSDWAIWNKKDLPQDATTTTAKNAVAAPKAAFAEWENCSQKGNRAKLFWLAADNCYVLAQNNGENFDYFYHYSQNKTDIQDAFAMPLNNSFQPKDAPVAIEQRYRIKAFQQLIDAQTEPQTAKKEELASKPLDLAISPSSYKDQLIPEWQEDLPDYIKEAKEFKEKYKSKEAEFKQLGFANGDDLVTQLTEACKNGDEIRVMAFFGHAGTDGIYANNGVGFEANGSSGGFNETTGSAEVKDLEKAIKEQKVKFHKDGIILFMHACNSYHDKDHVDDKGIIDITKTSLAEQLAIATQTPVVGAIGTTGSSGGGKEQYHTGFLDTYDSKGNKIQDRTSAKALVMGYYLIVPLGKGKGVETIKMGREITLEKAKEFLAVYRDKQKTMLQRVIEKKSEFTFMLQTCHIKATDNWVQDILKNEQNQKLFLQYAKEKGFENDAKELLNISKPLPPVQKIPNHEDEGKAKK